MSIGSPSIGDGDEASTAGVGLQEREPTASDVIKALETVMLCFEKQDVYSVKCNLQNLSFAKCAEINRCKKQSKLTDFLCVSEHTAAVSA